MVYPIRDEEGCDVPSVPTERKFDVGITFDDAKQTHKEQNATYEHTHYDNWGLL